MINYAYLAMDFQPKNDFLDLSFIGDSKYGQYKTYRLDLFHDIYMVGNDAIFDGGNPDDPYVFRGWKNGLRFNNTTQCVLLKNIVITDTKTPFYQMVKFGKYYFENVTIDVDKLEYSDLLFESCEVHFKNCIFKLPEDNRRAGLHFKKAKVLIEDSQITGGIFVSDNSQVKIVNSDIISTDNAVINVIVDHAKLMLENMNLTTNKTDYRKFPKSIQQRIYDMYKDVRQVAIQSRDSELSLDGVEYLGTIDDKLLESTNDDLQIKNLESLSDLQITNGQLKMQESQCRTLIVKGQAKVDLSGQNTIYALEMADQAVSFIEKLKINSLLKAQPIQVLDQARLVIEELQGYQTKDLSEYVELGLEAKSYILADQRQAQGRYSEFGLFIFKHEDKLYQLNLDEKELKRINKWLLDNQATDIMINVFEVDNKLESKVMGHIKYVKGKTDIINALKAILQPKFGDVEFIKFYNGLLQ